MKAQPCLIIFNKLFIVIEFNIKLKIKKYGKNSKILTNRNFCFDICLSFLKGCGTGTQVKTTEKKVDTLTTKVDSLSKIVVTQQEMIDLLLEGTTMWQTLIIEELSDKDHMPINHYRSESNIMKNWFHKQS